MGNPQRMCLGCGARRDKVLLVRLVAEGGRVIVDRNFRRPGRGAYVCPEAACLERFLKSKEDRLKRIFRSGQRLSAEGLREQVSQAAGWGVER